jgi:hypothetical protein
MKHVDICIAILSGFVFIQCESSNQLDSMINEELSKSMDTLPQDSIVTLEISARDSNQNVNHDQFRILKKIVLEEAKWTDTVDSIIVKESDSLSKFVYIKNMFDLHKIDSMEMYGRLEKNLNLKYHPELNSLIILYYNNVDNAFRALNFLDEHQFDEGVDSEDVFKAGGICFVLQNQLCIYPINSCGPGFKRIERIDSIISRNVFNDKNYDRLLDRCGMYRFTRLTN